MNKEQKRMLIQLMILTDKHNLLKDNDQNVKDYEKDKENAYYSLMSFIEEKGKD
tara:strand:- start:290 stop:451 length:162 start_codon:yes stop_codon:yes gene_type:complete